MVSIKYKQHPIVSDFECSSSGKYRRIGSSSVLVGKKRHTGFLYTSDGQLVHELIYTCFESPPKKGYKVCHHSTDVTDNRIENLVVKKVRDASEIRSTACANRKSIQVTNGSDIWRFKSKNSASKYFNISVSTVFACVERRRKDPCLNTESGQLLFTYSE